MENKAIDKKGKIYVLYDDGKNEVVARADVLSREQAEQLRSEHTNDTRTVSEVILCDNHNKLVNRFTFD